MRRKDISARRAVSEIGDLADEGKRTLGEFKAFLLRGNVVDLAVAVAVGAAFSGLVQAFVTDFITPLVGAMTGGSAFFGDRYWELNGSRLLYGDFLNKLVSFIAISGVVFFFVVKPVNHLMAKRKSKTDDESPKKDCPECLSTIPALAKRCAFCTAEQAAMDQA